MIRITDDDFSLNEIVSMASDPKAGAIVSFIGVVRDDGMDFMQVEAYDEAATIELTRIEQEARERFGLTSLFIIHRTGRLPIGDKIVLILCSAPHRDKAFEGCRYVIEELKLYVPIWKAEIKDEREEWK
jgi:molybdopterin synthase catalytic subunit